MKQLLILLLVSLGSFLQFSCNEIECTTPNNTQVNLFFYRKLNSGKDLGSLAERFPKKGIKIYYKEKGVFKTTSSSAKALYKYSPSVTGDTLVLTLETSNIYDDDFSEMLLELNENEKDTIRCKYVFSKGTKKCTGYTAYSDVWYNNVLLELDILLFRIEK